MSSKSDTRYILKHKPSGFYVTSATGLNTQISNAKLYETNAKHQPQEWSELMSTGDYVVIARTETTTIQYEEVPF